MLPAWVVEFGGRSEGKGERKGRKKEGGREERKRRERKSKVRRKRRREKEKEISGGVRVLGLKPEFILFFEFSKKVRFKTKF